MPVFPPRMRSRFRVDVPLPFHSQSYALSVSVHINLFTLPDHKKVFDLTALIKFTLVDHPYVTKAKNLSLHTLVLFLPTPCPSPSLKYYYSVAFRHSHDRMES